MPARLISAFAMTGVGSFAVLKIRNRFIGESFEVSVGRYRFGKLSIDPTQAVMLS